MKNANHNEILRAVYDKLCAQGTMSAAYAAGDTQLLLEASRRFDEALKRLLPSGYPGGVAAAGGKR